MNTIKAIVQNRRIEVTVSDDLPDGTEVVIDVMPVSAEKIGIDESEWRDDPEALADWEAWLSTIEPIERTSQEEAAHDRFDEEFRRFNVEAVRKQMLEGTRE
jgi:hypothetical protein